MRRAVFFVPDEDAYVKERTRLRAATQAGTWEHLEAVLFEWISCYSRGDESAALRKQFHDQVLPALAAYKASKGQSVADLSNPETYQVALAMLSITVLLDGGEPGIGQIREAFDSDGKDALLDRISTKSRPEPGTELPLLHPAPYRDLLQALDETQPLQQRNATLRYLRKYYEGIRAVAWHDSHLRPDGGFFGYWAFELAACVKLFGLDDRPYADNIFYPRDLVHDRLYRTWLPTGYGDSQRNAVAKLQAAWQKDADSQLGKIESELQKAQNSIRSFIEEALKLSQTEKSAKAAAQKFQRSAESLRFLSELTGLDTKELDANPDMAKSLIVGMLQTISETALKAGQGQMEGMEGLKNAMGEATAKMTEAEGVDMQALEESMPEELRQRLAELNGGDHKTAYQNKMQNFSKAVDTLIEDDKVAQDELLQALEKLAIEYGFAEPEPTVQEKVKGKLDAQWDELRKGKQMIDFTFEELFNGKKPAED